MNQLDDEVALTFLPQIPQSNQFKPCFIHICLLTASPFKKANVFTPDGEFGPLLEESNDENNVAGTWFDSPLPDNDLGIISGII